MNKIGLFITLEGIDGCGKTTQLHYLQDYLNKILGPTLIAKDPGTTNIGVVIKHIINSHQAPPTTELLLYLAARSDLTHSFILPNINKGTNIVCDRFSDSTLAYQPVYTTTPNLIIQFLSQIADINTTPNITLYLKISSETAMKRVANRAIKEHNLTSASILKSDKFDLAPKQMYDKVIKNYNQLSYLYPNRIKTIDAENTEKKVWQEIKTVIDTYIQSQKTNPSTQ